MNTPPQPALETDPGPEPVAPKAWRRSGGRAASASPDPSMHQVLSSPESLKAAFCMAVTDSMAAQGQPKQWLILL